MLNKVCFLFFAATVAGCIYCPSVLVAGAYGQQKGHFFYSLQSYYYSTDQYIDEKSDRHDRGGTYTKFELNPYLEYGVTDKDTVTVNSFYNWLTDDAPGSTRKTQGVTDLEIGWQHRILTGKNRVAAIHGMVIIPAGYSIDDDPRLGYNRFGAEASLLYGQSFKLSDKYGFVDLRLGYRDYLGYPSSQIRGNATVGYDILTRWQLLAAGDLQYGLKDGHGKQLGLNLQAQPNYRLLKLSLGARFRINAQYSLVVGGYQHVWGEETGGGGGGYVSLWYSN
ncbi:MAG: hypothetical protein JEZ12_15520 [Desulfobacterium sp.]|nr:hypothetical protein [Desulfobacterium sp.]